MGVSTSCPAKPPPVDVHLSNFFVRLYLYLLLYRYCISLKMQRNLWHFKIWISKVPDFGCHKWRGVSSPNSWQWQKRIPCQPSPWTRCDQRPGWTNVSKKAFGHAPWEFIDQYGKLLWPHSLVSWQISSHGGPWSDQKCCFNPSEEDRAWTKWRKWWDCYNSHHHHRGKCSAVRIFHSSLCIVQWSCISV